MQIQRAWLTWIIIACGLAVGIPLATILILPSFISEDFLQQEVARTIKERFEPVRQIGRVSFHWPNKVAISSLTIQREDRRPEAQILLENIQGTLQLLPALWKEIAVKKIDIRQMNYENRLLVEDLVTDTFSFKKGVLTIHARFKANDGPAAVRGVIDLHQKRPVFDLTFEAKGMQLTRDIPVISLIPIFVVKEGDIGGVLSLSGSLQGNGMGRDILNKELTATVNFTVQDGYIQGNKVLSSLLEMLGEPDRYSFDSLDAVVRIKDGKIFTQKMEMQGPLAKITASGTAEFEGAISYDAQVQFHKERMGTGIEKIAGLVLEHQTLPIEIRGTTKDPKVAVKLNKENLEHLFKGLVNDFLHKPKKEKKQN
ncbi:MAG: AsmA-like C-terminal region-containing protein [Candidatus Brocadia sp.]|uniref:Uncharacterized protein n=1 Tax=Candidatus Brocadia fulgida TaxID=380242 RepID=A0A0M2UQH7_9BACT|nr:MAG: hypothetical protein BROFUL_03171 [Candidatus Brocadia fulgida]UJS19307.1 MAG: AsmA-like C-terminal region-containing protein [Candidatus Brocadia sp.]